MKPAGGFIIIASNILVLLSTYAKTASDVVMLYIRNTFSDTRVDMYYNINSVCVCVCVHAFCLAVHGTH